MDCSDMPELSPWPTCRPGGKRGHVPRSPKEAFRHAVQHYPVAMTEGISIDPAVCHGKPVIHGTRVLVSTILGALAGGDSREAIV